MDRETLRRYIVTNEGWRSRVYHDSLGIPTIGVGFNLNRQDAQEKITQLGLSYDQVVNGQVELSTEQINTLLNDDINNAINAASSTFSNFDQISSDRQIALVDLAFNLGPTRLSGFRRMINAVNAGNWAQAAAELQDSNYYTQVGRRARWNVQAINTGNLPNFNSEKPKEAKESSEGSENKETKEGSDGSEDKESKEGSEGSENSERKEEKEGSEESEGKEGKDRKEGSDGKEEKDGSEGSEGKEEKDGSEGSEGKEDSDNTGKERLDCPVANDLRENSSAGPNDWTMNNWLNNSI